MKEKLEIFYQIYDENKKGKIIIIEEFYEDNDKNAKKYKKELYGKEFNIRKGKLMIKYTNI